MYLMFSVTLIEGFSEALYRIDFTKRVRIHELCVQYTRECNNLFIIHIIFN